MLIVASVASIDRHVEIEKSTWKLKLRSFCPLVGVGVTSFICKLLPARYGCLLSLALQ